MPSVTLRIFVGSTWLDLQPERAAVEKALQRMQTTKFNGMEYFGSRDDTTRAASLKEVERSQLYVGIFGGRYGSSITEDEYRSARELGLQCFIYFKDESTITQVDEEPEKQAKLQALKQELRQQHLISAPFTNADELATQVATDVHNWIVNDFLPAQQQPLENRALHQLSAPPSDFTGRAAELQAMRANLQRGVTISGVQGLGGVGKTARALKLAAEINDRYAAAQFYLDLKGASAQPLSAAEALSHVIRAYHLTARLPETVEQLQPLYLSVLQEAVQHGQGVLLLFDNAASRAQVEPLMPPAGCVLLVTSRQHLTLPGMFEQNLEALPPEDARALLLRLCARLGAEADELAKLCGRLPLALRVAGSFLRERRDYPVGKYLERLRAARLQQLPEVAASLGFSYELLPPAQQARWRALAVFPNTFDLAAAAAVWETEEDAAQEALSELTAYSLLDWEDATSRYRLHDLARDYARDCASAAEHQTSQQHHAEYFRKVLASARALYEQGGEAIVRGMALYDQERVNIEAGHAWAESNAGAMNEAAQLCIDYPNAGVYALDLRQHPRERIRWLELALTAARRLKRRSSEGVALGNLGITYKDLGETRKAIEFYEQRLAIAREIGDRRGEGNAVWNMSLSLDKLGDRAQAITCAEAALRIYEAIEDPIAGSVRRQLAEWRGEKLKENEP
jgi:tetratricopeptide (TPR) repeat protein